MAGFKPSVELIVELGADRVVDTSTGHSLRLTPTEVKVLTDYDGRNAIALAELRRAQGVDVTAEQVAALLDRLERAGFLVSLTGPTGPAQNLKPPELLDSDVVPMFREDLKVAERPGSKAVLEVLDPRQARSFSLYDFEVSIARMLNGRRTVAEVMESAAKIGIPVTVTTLAGFIRQLKAYGFLAAAPPAEKVLWDTRRAWSPEVRELFQSGLRLFRANRFKDALEYLGALLEIDPANADAQDLKRRCDDAVAGAVEVPVSFDDLHRSSPSGVQSAGDPSWVNVSLSGISSAPSQPPAPAPLAAAALTEPELQVPLPAIPGGTQKWNVPWEGKGGASPQRTALFGAASPSPVPQAPMPQSPMTLKPGGTAQWPGANPAPSPLAAPLPGLPRTEPGTGGPPATPLDPATQPGAPSPAAPAPAALSVPVGAAPAAVPAPTVQAAPADAGPVKAVSSGPPLPAPAMSPPGSPSVVVSSELSPAPQPAPAVTPPTGPPSSISGQHPPVPAPRPASVSAAWGDPTYTADSPPPRPSASRRSTGQLPARRVPSKAPWAIIGVGALVVGLVVAALVPVSNHLTVRGEVKAITVALVLSPRDGEVEELRAPDKAVVHKGEVLATLSTGKLEDERRTVVQQVSVVQGELRALQLTAVARKKAAEATLARAKAELLRLQVAARKLRGARLQAAQKAIAAKGEAVLHGQEAVDAFASGSSTRAVDEKLAGLRARVKELDEEVAHSAITAPADGAFLSPGATTGTAVKKGESFGTVVDPARRRFVGEAAGEVSSPDVSQATLDGRLVPLVEASWDGRKLEAFVAAAGGPALGPASLEVPVAGRPLYKKLFGR